MQSIYAVPTIFFTLLCGAAVLGDMIRTRRRRTNPERIGLMPWPLIMVLSLLLAAVCAGLWLRDN